MNEPQPSISLEPLDAKDEAGRREVKIARGDHQRSVRRAQKAYQDAMTERLLAELGEGE